jgi:hypothetical protein
MAKRKGQQDNDLQNTTQKTKDRATRTPLSHRLKKERQYNGQKKKDNHLQNTTQKTKDRVTRTTLSHRLKKERQYNGQKKGTTRQ